MKRSLPKAAAGIAALLTAALLAPSVWAAEPAGPAFAVGARSPGNTGYEMEVSEDKKAGIVMFDGLKQESFGSAPLFETRVFSISLPLQNAGTGVKVGVFLDGFVDKEKGTDVSLITTVNGEAHVMDFANGAEDKNCGKFPPANEIEAVKRKAGARYAAPQKPKFANKPEAEKPRESALSRGFVQCILLDAPQASDVRVNMVLVTNRRDRETFGGLEVASLSFGIQPGDTASK